MGPTDEGAVAGFKGWPTGDRDWAGGAGWGAPHARAVTRARGRKTPRGAKTGTRETMAAMVTRSRDPKCQLENLGRVNGQNDDVSVEQK